MVCTEKMSSNALVAVLLNVKVKSKEAWREVLFEEETNEVRKAICLNRSLFSND